MFTHLHVHSHYSLLDGLPKVDELLNRAKELGMKALALTDHGVMYGAIEFYKKAKELGIKPIIGVEIYLARHGMHQKRAKIDTKPYHLVLLAKNKVGYKNLIKIVTTAHLEGYYYKPRIDFDFLKNHAKGLVALTACLEGEIPSLILAGDIDKAISRAKEYQELFGQENFYLELQDHLNMTEQKQVNEELIRISKKLNIPLVLTNDVHYLNKEDAEIQDILLCIQTQKKVQDKDRLSMLGEDFSLKAPKEITSRFLHIPEAIENTERIAAMCNLELELGKVKLPYFPVPEGETPDSYLKKLAYQGLSKKFGIKGDQLSKDIISMSEAPSPRIRKILQRLDYELTIIEKTGFASYLLIVQDFVNWAKKNGIVVGPGRGSAAGSLVCYLLDITEVDPIKYDLLFERFLNPERISMPDIDLDFSDTRRDEVINYVKNKYGQNHVAQIITFGTMASRAAVRDCVRVLGYPYTFGDRIAKLIPMNMSIEEAINRIYELKDLYERDPEVKKILDYAKKLEGVARHASTHACGVVIAPEDLDEYAPRQYASQQDGQTIVTQYEMHSIEDLGLLKMDFLGLKNLTVIQNTIKIIEKTKGEKINIHQIPLNDEKTFKLLQEGNTTGVFQLESAGMKRYLRQLKPTELENIIAMVALHRPGPIEWIPSYIAGKQGKKKISYIHPKLKASLEKTYGVPIYQEQIMQIAQDLAGFTLAEADVLRKAVGKKIRSLLLEQKKKFINGCIANNVPQHIAEKVFSFIEPFAGYGFNRSHAACYAMIAYQTAYLKANYPVEFMASLLTADQENTDRVAVEIAECANMNIEILPPDVNESYPGFTVIKKDGKEAIRFGLNAIKNLGSNVIERIIEEKKKNGKFKNLDDFINRIASKDFNKKSLESLAKSGALDKFGERNQILANIEKILAYGRSIQKAKLQGQTNLFSNSTIQNEFTPQLKLEKSTPATKKERLSWEKELLGFYVSDHPVKDYQNYFQHFARPCSSLDVSLAGQRVTVGGIITGIKKIITKTSEPMLFVELEDLTKTVEVLVFPSVLQQNPTVWQEDNVVLISGKVSDKDGEVKILCDEARKLDLDFVKRWEKENKNLISRDPKSPIQITIKENTSPDFLYKLRKVLEDYHGQREVILKIPGQDGKLQKIKTEVKINYNPQLAERIEALGKMVGARIEVS